MDILLLGGTGAMGTYLQQLLDNGNNVITVTSRKNHESNVKTIKYIKGNAKDLVFLKQILLNHYDVIVDFMSYSTADFKLRYELFLNNTKQYVFISSARVYAQSDKLITENCPRLLDVCTDKEYLNTDEYALAKARCEDLLEKSGKKNFTIIRPSITYGDGRLQLGVLEKENWLYRALHGRSIVFSDDIATKLTAMTKGYDVARGISSIIGKEEALGETFHITCEKSYTWQDILFCYMDVLGKHGFNPKIVMTEKSTKFGLGDAFKYQIIYCRYFNRTFDNSKIKRYVDVDSFTQPIDGLNECLSNFLENPEFRNINWHLEALNDIAAHERTPLKEIPTLKSRVGYICYRYHLGFLIEFLKMIKNGL